MDQFTLYRVKLHNDRAVITSAKLAELTLPE